ncbi:MAG: hypothetical protein CMG13_03610 [Candidatus Marinimicrobia bacterium]|nr:hypothetical protein [Candidatus Neomarinimicrobiota bacterium]
MQRPFLFLLFFITVIFSQSILHSPIDESVEKNPILVEAFINIPDYEIKKVSLFFRKRGELKYVETPMFKIDLDYLGEIPGNFVDIRGIEYFVVVDTYDMGLIALPNIGPTDNPFRVDVKEKKIIYTERRLKELDPKYTILSPDPDTRVIDDEVMLSMSYFQMSNIDSSETKILINDTDISDKVDFRDSYFVYYPEEINYGVQNVEVFLIDDFGVEYNPIEWSFEIIKEEDVSLFAFKQSGKVKTDYASSIVDTVNFKESTVDLIYNGKFDWLDFRTNIHLSSLEDRSDQPKNRFFADFRSEFVRLRIGDVYPNFGENFIKRNRVRGLDFHFNASKYSINFILGETNRATQGSPFDDAVMVSNLSVDKIYDDNSNPIGVDDPSFDIDRNNYSFSRKLSAFQIKFPIKNNMNLKFNILKAKDDVGSVYKNVSNAVVRLPEGLNEYVDEDSQYLQSTEIVQKEVDEGCSDLSFDSQLSCEANGDSWSSDYGDGIPDTDEDGNLIFEDTPNYYVSNSNLISNYSRIFNSTLTGSGLCVDSAGIEQVGILNQNDCELGNNQWVLQGVCYEIEVDPVTLEEVVTDDIIIGATNQILCSSSQGSWDPFFKINQLENQWQGVKPKDNIVIGSEYEAFFDQERLRFRIGSSFSLLNENIWDPILTYESLDVLGDDPEDGMLAGYEIPENLDFSKYENIFRSGINQVPLLPVDIISGQSSILRILTMPSLTYSMSLQGNYYGHKILYDFKQVGSEYNSLGNLYLQQDIREQTLSDKVGFLDNKLYVNFKYKLTEEGVSFNLQEKGRTNKFDIIFNFSPGAGLARLNSAIGFQSRTNGVNSNDYIDYSFDDDGNGEIDSSEEIFPDIDSRKESTELLQFNFALTTPVNFYGTHNLTISYYNSTTNDLVADNNILYSFESESEYDIFPYFSKQSNTSTTNLNLQSTHNAFFITTLNCSQTSFDYGLDISNYYRILDERDDIFTVSDEVDKYSYNTALSNIEKFEQDYGDLLYQRQILRSIELQATLKTYLIFDTVKLGAHLSDAQGVVNFEQYGLSLSIIKNLMDNFYISFDYENKLKNIVGGDKYNNSYSFLRLGYQF